MTAVARTYRIGAGSRLEVRARSSIHDTVTVWDRLAGTVQADPATLETSGATATFTVDMTSFDAGDRLKNGKIRGDFQIASHPQATFALGELTDIRRDGARFTATARGVLRWRGQEVPLVLMGTGELGETSMHAEASFQFDIRQVGLTAPKILFFKVANEVTVTVTVRGTVA